MLFLYLSYVKQLKIEIMHRILISISTSKYFDTQSEMAEFLDIKGTSKKAISSRCRVNGWGVEFNEHSEYNIEI